MHVPQNHPILLESYAMNICVYSPDPAQAKAFQANVQEACEILGIDTVVEFDLSPEAFAATGVANPPALTVDGKVVSFGSVLGLTAAAKVLLPFYEACASGHEGCDGNCAACKAKHG